MPDPLDLDAIEYRANAATPGPWEWTRPEFSPSSDCHVLLSSATTTSYGHTARIEVHSDGSAYGEYNPDIDVNGPDAALIANARTDIPALVARVRELESDLHAAGVWAGMRDNAADRADRDAEVVERRLNAEVDRLRELAAEHQRAIVELAAVYNARDAHTKAVEAELDARTRQHAARGAEAVAVIDGLRVEVAEFRARETALITAADADERAHRERAGLNTDGTMVRTAEEALSWLISGLSVERAANRIANEDIVAVAAACGCGEWEVVERVRELANTLTTERAEMQGYCDRLLADGTAAANANDDLRARIRELEAEHVCDLADVDRFRAMARTYMDERDELRATLANERGEGEGPSEGWEWASYPGRWDNPNGWSMVDRGLSFAAVGRNAYGTGWDWHAMVPGALRGGVGGTAPTAREAMRQAERARAGGAK